MYNIDIAGTGIWYPENKITNDELVDSYNSYVDLYNAEHIESINIGDLNN